MIFIDYLQTHTGVFIAWSALLGILIGSFLNVVIVRLPIMMMRDWREQCAGLCREWGSELAGGESPTKAQAELGSRSETAGEGVDDEPFNLMVPRSHCPHCGHTLSVMENIPLIGYLLLRGRCAACALPICPRYPFVELLSGVLAGVVAWRLGFGIPVAFALIFTWALIALAFIDFEHQQLPDDITLPLLWLGLAINLFSVYASLADAVIGAIAGYGILWVVYHIFRLLTGKEGMGHGDFKLLAMVGAWLGWQALPAVILLSSIMGAMIGIALILLRGHDRNVPIPFGPYIAIAAWIALLWGDFSDTVLGFYAQNGWVLNMGAGLDTLLSLVYL
ncbi:MAG: A24 family peptidase [Gammaproteobacteria bacterium]|nr:A24 family peptidase [Gammaproteobacteria bacterium]